MALTIFQETIPFSNERLDQPSSQGGLYTNPIIMPLSFDVVQYTNTLEVVFYIRNNDISKYYNNVLVYLAKKDMNISDPNLSRTVLLNTLVENGVTKYKAEFRTDNSGATNNFKELFFTSNSETLVTYNNKEIIGVNRFEVPIDTAYADIDVKFSYGYDELSNVDWEDMKEALVITKIGNSSMPDTSYLPIRMRITLNTNTLSYTLRDYSIGIVYENETGL